MMREDDLLDNKVPEYSYSIGKKTFISIGFLILSLGIFSKIMHWPFGVLMIICSSAILHSLNSSNKCNF